MFLAPFSELTGRRPMFLITGFLFLIFVITCAVTRLYAGMLVSRFLAGCASSTFSTMVGGVVSDIYVAKERNTAMTLFTSGALFGTGKCHHGLQVIRTELLLTDDPHRHGTDGLWICRLQSSVEMDLLCSCYWCFRRRSRSFAVLQGNQRSRATKPKSEKIEQVV